MSRKILWVVPILILAVIATLACKYKKNYDLSQPIISPLAQTKEIITDAFDFKKGSSSIFKEKPILNILLLGIDRRSKQQMGYNTDVMILVSVNPNTNKVLLTSVPRDLWINGNKINALYYVYGWETLRDAFNQITGQEIQGYIKTDFEDFKWLIDSFGGVPVDVQNSFADNTFPNDTDTDIVTVAFTQGIEKMSGDRALTFARSRKGNNGEGSDLMRAKRQHLVLKGLLEAVQQPESIFWPMDIETFFHTVTTARMETTLTLEDSYYLWDFYKDRDRYDIESFVVDDGYVYHPGIYPESPYTAWVFIAREPGFTNLHQDITAKLNKTYQDSNLPKSTEDGKDVSAPYTL